jgi:hypothetical protein
MRKFLAKKICLAVVGSLLMSGFLAAPLFAQHDNEDREARRAERQEAIQQRREEFRENNPEAAARREEFRENNPEAAQARREQRRERMRNGEGPPPGFERRGRGPDSNRTPRP